MLPQTKAFSGCLWNHDIVITLFYIYSSSLNPQSCGLPVEIKTYFCLEQHQEEGETPVMLCM